MPCINNLYLFCIEKTREHVSLHLQQAKCQLRVNYSTRWNVVLSQDICIPETLFATHSGDQRANHTAMTYPSEMDWPKPNGITHRAYLSNTLTFNSLTFLAVFMQLTATNGSYQKHVWYLQTTFFI